MHKAPSCKTGRDDGADSIRNPWKRSLLDRCTCQAVKPVILQKPGNYAEGYILIYTCAGISQERSSPTRDKITIPGHFSVQV